MPELVAVDFNPFKSPSNPGEFASRYGAAAEKAGKALGVDPQVLLGQWGLETGWGKSVIPGTNNLGNIKDFSGSGTSAKDNMNGSVDKYRTYESPEAFADDFTSLIQRKYPDAVGAKDPQAFAQALKAGGYAEDPRYVDKVVQASRMAGSRPNPVMAAVGNAVESVIPSAQAAEAGPQLVPVDFDPFAKKEQPSAASRLVSGAVQGTKDLAGGLVRGAGSIGATLLAPGDAIQDAMAGRPLMATNKARRAGMDAGLQTAGADPNSLNYGAGKLVSEIAGTAGTGNILGAGAQALGAGPKVVNALQSGGMTLGQTGGSAAGNLLTRAAGGAATGGAAAGLVNPEDAGTGALIGGALPVATKIVGTAGNALGRSLSGGQMAPEVKALADRAKQLGIDIPADRLVNSKPLNALASSLDYVPGSGRSATMGKMEDQLNQAVSRTFGQNSSNVTQALRQAGNDLGAKFDTVLKSNTVKVDQQFLTDLADASAMASKELGSDGARIISNQIDEILGKAQSPQSAPLKKIEIPLASDASLNKVEASLPPVPEGFTRLYRGESPTVKFQDVFDSSGLTGQRASHLKGDRFTTDIKYADYYRKSYGRDAKLSYVDVPSSIAEKGRVDASEIKLPSELFNSPFASGGQVAIDGQAAYNIKKTLDRIGKRNSPEAHYALDLKGKLMDALNRSLGQTEAEAFKTVRQQYGNMLSMEKIAQNGAEGGVSIARLANMKNINNAELQELADISAQFLKSREGAHGAAQRVGAGALAFGLGGPAGLAAGMASGRGANMLLNSSAVKNRLMSGGAGQIGGLSPEAAQLMYRASPVLAGDR